jgi:HEAT repeat protein
MIAFGPARLSQKMALCTLIVLYTALVQAQELPDHCATVPCATRATNLWLEPSVKATLRALDRFARRPDLAATSVSRLIPGLKHPDPDVRARVAEVLTGIAPPAASAAIPALIDALDDPDQNVSDAAASAIGSFGAAASRAIPCLLRCVRSDQGGRRHAAQSALAKIGLPAAPALIALLEDDHATIRLAAADALASMRSRPDSAIPAILSAARKSNQSDRRAILAELTRIGAEAAVPLARSLRTGDASYRADAASALAWMSSFAQAAAPILIERLGVPKTDEIDDALVAIGASAVPALCEQLKRPDVPLRARVARILGRIGPAAAEAAPRLTSFLEDHDLRIESADALDRICPEKRDDTHSLFAALKGRCSASRAKAADVLGRIGGGNRKLARHILRFLIPVTRDPDPRVRAASVRSIGKIESHLVDHWPGLTDLLDDPASEVRAAAVEALARLRDPGATRAHRARLLHDPDQSVRVAAVRSMASVDMRSVEVVAGLIESLNDSSVGVRAAAAEKLVGSGEWTTQFEGVDPRLTRMRACQRIRRSLADPDPRVRAAAARILPRFKREATDAQSLLCARTKDESVLVRRAAVDALAQLRPDSTESISPLVDRLSDFSPSGSHGETVASAAAGALLGMGREAKSALFGRLISQLASTDQNLRRMSSRLLSNLGPESLAPLERILAAPGTPRSLRIRAMRALLGREADSDVPLNPSGSRRLPELRGILPMLKTMVRDEDLLVRLHAFRLICAIDRDPVLIAHSFLAAAREQDPAAMIVFDDLFEFAEIPLLLAALNDPDPDLRTAIINALGQTAMSFSNPDSEPPDNAPENPGSPATVNRKDRDRCKAEIVRALSSSLDDPDTQVRWAAVYAFDALESDHPGVFNRLIEMASDTTTRVRRGATISLMNLLDENSENDLRKAVDEKLRIAAIQALASEAWRRPAAVPALIDALHDSDPLTRLHAVTALGSMGMIAKPAVPALTELLRAKSLMSADAAPLSIDVSSMVARIKSAAIASLVSLGADPSLVIPELITLLSHPLLTVRENAAGLLSELGPAAAPAVPALLRLIESGALECHAAAQIVSEIGPPGLDVLERVIANADFPKNQRDAALKVLALLDGDSREIGEFGPDLAE